MKSKKIRISVGIIFLVIVVFSFQFHRLFIYAGDVEPVTFQSGTIELAGVIVTPKTAGPHPAVIVLHGSEPGTFDHPAARLLTNVFVRRGFAVLTYDKRGAGASGGNFKTAVYEDFIGDAVSSVEYLRTRKDIVPGRIGLFGNSESGWFTPEIASRAHDILFIINRVGPPVTWIVTNLWEVKYRLIEADYTESEIADILPMRKRVWNYYIQAAVDESFAMGAERDAINTALSDLRAKQGRTDISNLPEYLPEYDQQKFAGWASFYSYDPLPFLTEIDIPILYVFGEYDENVPTEESVVLLEQLIQERHKDITYRVFPNVGHTLMTLNVDLHASGYLELIGSWGEGHINLTGDSK